MLEHWAAQYPADLLWLVISLAILVALKGWLQAHLQGVLLLIARSPDIVLYVSFLVLLPGIALHELSHWMAAKLLGVRTRGLSLIPRKGQGRQIYYGSVRIVASDPLRHSLIGLAPLLAGSIAILLCARYGLGLAPLRAPSSLPELSGYLRAPDAPLWLYLIFAISNAMLPSESDRQPWLPVGLFLGLVALLLVVTNLISLIPLAVAAVASYTASYLAYAFTLTIAVDLLFSLLILVTENTIAFLSRRKVRY